MDGDKGEVGGWGHGGRRWARTPSKKVNGDGGWRHKGGRWMGKTWEKHE